MNADLDFPTGFRRVRRVDVGFRTCIRRCRCWVLRRRRRPARRGSDRGRWVRAAVGGKRGRSEGNFKKKVRTGGELGLTRVHGRYRPRTGWKPGIGLGGMPPCFSHATAAMPSTRYSAGARRSDERASATAFLNAGAVTSSRRITARMYRPPASPRRRLTNARTTGVRHSPPHIRARRESTGASTKGEGGASTGHRAGS